FLCTSLLFFFSSRRRHTRFSRDWSSDVCSSDLVEFTNRLVNAAVGLLGVAAVVGALRRDPRRSDLVRWALATFAWIAGNGLVGEIGRASCRERGEISGGAGAVKKRKRGDETAHE